MCLDGDRTSFLQAGRRRYTPRIHKAAVEIKKKDKNNGSTSFAHSTGHHIETNKRRGRQLQQ
jgi:hypothetical protein